MNPPDPKAPSRPETPVTAPKRRRRRPRRQAVDALIIFVLVALIAYGVYRYYEEILEALYSRTAMVVLVVMVIEFLILKSFDRTRLYRIENNRLVRRRMADLQALREAESALANLVREPPMAPTEELRQRQLKGSMITETDDHEDPNNPSPIKERPDTGHDAEDSHSGEQAASPSPEALREARRALRHIRKRIY